MKNNIEIYTNKIIEIWKKESSINPALLDKMHHSERVANYIQLLTNNYNDIFYGWVHDIGRIEQYYKIKCYDDNKYNHANAGIDYIYKNNIEFLENWEEAKDIIRYHSNYNKAPSDKNTPLLYYVTIADQLDNALTCKNYLLEDEKNNSKNFITDNYLSQYFIEAINDNNIFIDKINCKTYLDYFYFAYTLLLRSLKNKDILAIMPNINKNDLKLSLEFFRKLFDERLDYPIKENVLNGIDLIIKKYI